jgi:hypothetical protein
LQTVLVGAAATVAVRLTADESPLDVPARFTLRAEGPAVFASRAQVGRLVSGGGTPVVVLEALRGEAAIEVVGSQDALVQLRGEDSERFGIVFAGAVELRVLDPQGDPDADGLSSELERARGTDPLDADSDDDGLRDDVETGTGVFRGASDTGTDPLNPDTDAGGMPDGEEMARGQDPHDPADDLVPRQLPVSLVDGEGFLWDLNRDGSVSDGTSDAFDGALSLSVGATVFPGAASGRLGLGGQRLVIGPLRMGRLEVTRDIFVPASGGAFARYLEVLHNPGAAAASTSVTISGNLGSDSSTQVVATSSGDLTVSASDLWFITDDGDRTGDPTLTFVVAGETGSLQPALLSLQGDGFTLRYDVEVPAGGTVAVLHLVAQSRDQARAGEKARDLVELRGRAAEGIGEELAASVVNFVVAPPDEVFVRGDANGDRRVDLSDVVFTLGFVFLAGRPPAVLDSADANDDGRVNSADAVRLLLFLFSEFPPPPPPFPRPGRDPTPEGTED